MSLNFEDWQGKLIVSCQAQHFEPLYGSEMMGRMALAAWQGGAVAIRANSPKNIQRIKEMVPLPIVGIYKEEPKQSEVFITPTLEMALAVAKAGADVIALDGTSRKNKDGVMPRQFIREIKQCTGKPVMADIATLEEAEACLCEGADIISTTLSGYITSQNPETAPDYALIRSIRSHFGQIWINAEGRIATKKQAAHAIECGASFVTVGTAITRPQWITLQFTDYLGKIKEKKNGN